MSRQLNKQHFVVTVNVLEASLFSLSHFVEVNKKKKMHQVLTVVKDPRQKTSKHAEILSVFDTELWLRSYLIQLLRACTGKY